MKIKIFLAAVLSVSVMAMGLLAGPAFQNGKWEITSQTEMVGSQFKIPPVTYTQCLDNKNMVPQNKQNNNKDCKMLKQTVKGGTVSWEMVCDGKDSKAQGKGQIIYKDSTMAGDFTIKTTAQGKELTIINKMTGKRIGVCE